MTTGDTPFRHWIVNDWCRPVPTHTLPPLGSPAWEAHYANDVESGKHTSRRLELFPAVVVDVFARLRSAESVAEWAERAGVESLRDDPHMHGAGVHLSHCLSWLQVHADYELHPHLPETERRLNLIAFLHPEWRPEWGGQLLLCDGWGKAVAEIDPLPGRLVAFECGPASYHGVRQTTADAPPRVSAAVYLLADARPSAVRRRAMFLPNRNGGGCPSEVCLP